LQIASVGRKVTDLMPQEGRTTQEDRVCCKNQGIKDANKNVLIARETCAQAKYGMVICFLTPSILVSPSSNFFSKKDPNSFPVYL
jgi:hypothetical protein